MFKYTQKVGSDKFQNEDSKGNTTNRGKAVYDKDGSLKRLDVYSPSKPGWHHHEWMNKKSDGTYEYGHGEHKNH